MGNMREYEVVLNVKGVEFKWQGQALHKRSALVKSWGEYRQIKHHDGDLPPRTVEVIILRKVPDGSNL